MDVLARQSFDVRQEIPVSLLDGQPSDETKQVDLLEHPIMQSLSFVQLLIISQDLDAPFFQQYPSEQPQTLSKQFKANTV